jgi:hypothetical protein
MSTNDRYFRASCANIVDGPGQGAFHRRGFTLQAGRIARYQGIFRPHGPRTPIAVLGQHIGPSQAFGAGQSVLDPGSGQKFTAKFPCGGHFGRWITQAVVTSSTSRQRSTICWTLRPQYSRTASGVRPDLGIRVTCIWASSNPSPEAERASATAEPKPPP